MLGQDSTYIYQSIKNQFTIFRYNGLLQKYEEVGSHCAMGGAADYISAVVLLKDIQ
jgi:hypothetical protein